MSSICRKFKLLNHQIEESISKYKVMLAKKEQEKAQLLRDKEKLLNESKHLESSEETEEVDCPVTLQHYQPPKAVNTARNCCYIITNLQSSISKLELSDFFSKVGVIERIFISTSGTAYIYFQGFYQKPPPSFEFNIKGHRIRAVEKPLNKSRSIVVSGNISRLKKSHFVNYFSRFGEIVNFTDTSKKTGHNSWGYVFIKFKDSLSADEAYGKI
jgi:RNA recognition motif-containing protein